MLKNFQHYINNNGSFLKGKKLLIAISGGLDSVVLTQLCSECQLEVALAHCNFNLRGKESDGDEAFVLDLAERLHLEAFTVHFDTEAYAKTHKLSIQMAARELRYNWFEDLATQLQFDYILTAHHADDNLETFLINVSRGTGLDGLLGIPECNNNIVRPLLQFSRETIKNYAEQTSLQWRDDSSNASTKYLRNKLRHDVIPELKSVNEQFLNNFSTTLKHLKSSSILIDDAINTVKSKIIIEENEQQIVYSISELKKIEHPKVYLYHIFKDYGFTEYNDICHLIDSQSGKQVISKTHRLLKDRETLLLVPLIPEQLEEALIINSEVKTIKTKLGILSLESVSKVDKIETLGVYVDNELLEFPLTLRHWEHGDYFYPLGMQGKKKLSKFFKDEKYSLIDKEKTLVLCSNNAIVWVVNHRLDNRFKVSKQTKNITKITFQK